MQSKYQFFLNLYMLLPIDMFMLILRPACKDMLLLISMVLMLRLPLCQLLILAEPLRLPQCLVLLAFLRSRCASRPGMPGASP